MTSTFSWSLFCRSRHGVGYTPTRVDSRRRAKQRAASLAVLACFGFITPGTRAHAEGCWWPAQRPSMIEHPTTPFTLSNGVTSSNVGFSAAAGWVNSDVPRCMSAPECFDFIIAGANRANNPYTASWWQKINYRFNKEPRPELNGPSYPFDCEEPVAGAKIVYCGFGFEMSASAIDQPPSFTPYSASIHGRPQDTMRCEASMMCPPGQLPWSVTRVQNGASRKVSECTRVKDIYTRPEMCPSAGDVSPLSGLFNKSFDSDLSIGAMPVVVTFDDAAAPANQPPLDHAGTLGDQWFISTHGRLARSGLNTVAVRGTGEMVVFNEGDTSVQSATTSSRQVDQLLSVPTGQLYRSQREQRLEAYDASGQLTGWTTREGRHVTVTSQGPDIIAIRDDSGRGLDFTYRTGARSRRTLLESISLPGGARTLTAGYDAGDNLVQLAWSDGSVRRFGYEDPVTLSAMTRIIDENDANHAAFTYARTGQLASSELAGGVERYAAAYTTPPQPTVREVYDQVNGILLRYHEWKAPTGTTVTLPNAATSTFTATVVDGAVRVTGVTQPAGAGCAAASRQVGYDEHGNVASRDDFNGHRACFRHEPTRNLEQARVEGLPAATECAGLLAPGAALPAGARAITSEWHPDWDLVVRRAEPGRITSFVYNGRPDPTRGGEIAACAPAEALLPDGKPTAVLCRVVVQATTDLTGAMGLGAPLAAVPTRQTSYTYDASGRVLSEDGPRTDVADVTKYGYHEATTEVARIGDLASVTDAMGKVTKYTRYTVDGKLQESIGPTGLVTTYTYDGRGRLATKLVGTKLTSFAYDPAGQLIRVTNPDATFTSYTYDAAHRLVGSSNSRGESIEYTLDGSGQVVEKKVKSADGKLARLSNWFFDALGRIQRIVGLG